MIVRLCGFLLFVGLLSYRSISSLSRKGQVKEAVVYGILMGICALIGSLYIAEVEIPSPLTLYQAMFEPIGKMLLK